jgi:hypothetical protein
MIFIILNIIMVLLLIFASTATSLISSPFKIYFSMFLLLPSTNKRDLLNNEVLNDEKFQFLSYVLF